MADDLFAVSVAVDLDDAGEEGVTGKADEDLVRACCSLCLI